MSKRKVQLYDANNTTLHPLTLGECVTMDNGENLDILMSKSQMFTPIITQDENMFKVGTGVDVDYSANVKDGAYESLVFKGKSLVNLMTSCKDETLIQYYNPPADSNVANVSMIKPNTVYTIIYSAKYREEGNTGHLIVRTQQDGGDINVASGFTFGTTYKRFAYKFTTPSTIDYFVLRSNGHYFHVKEVMLLEGDYTNVSIPYFEGLCDSKMPILKNIGKNLINFKEKSQGWSGAYILNKGGNKITFMPNTNGDAAMDATFELKNNVLFKAGTTFTYSARRVEGGNSDFQGQINNRLLLSYEDGTEETIHSPDFKSSNFDKTLTITFTLSKNCTNIKTKPIMYTIHNLKSPIVLEYQLEESELATPIEPYKTSILETSNDVVLRGLPNGVRDSYDCLTGEYVQRVGETTITDTTPKSIVVLDNNIRVNISLPQLNCVNGTTKANNTLSSDFNWSEANARDIEGMRVNGNTFHWCISKNKLSTHDLQGVNTYLSEKPLTFQYELAEPIVTTIKPSTTPFAYENGHIILESGHEGQSLLPTLEYSVVMGRTGQVIQNAKTLRKQEGQIVSLEELLLTQIVQMEYERTLLQFDYGLQMTMLG